MIIIRYDPVAGEPVADGACEDVALDLGGLGYLSNIGIVADGTVYAYSNLNVIYALRALMADGKLKSPQDFVFEMGGEKYTIDRYGGYNTAPKQVDPIPALCGRILRGQKRKVKNV